MWNNYTWNLVSCCKLYVPLHFTIALLLVLKGTLSIRIVKKLSLSSHLSSTVLNEIRFELLIIW